MLTDQELSLLYQKLNITKNAQRVIETIRSSPPSRRVGSNGKNMPVQYVSKKMGVIIQAESFKVELAGAYEMDYNDHEVLEFYDQPPPITLKYKAGNRVIGVLYTPDYFVIRTNSVGWEEWKEEKELERLEQTMPHRYQRGTDREWCCPPGEEVAEPLGFYFHVRSSREINWILQRNLRFLSYYWGNSCPPVSKLAREEILSLIPLDGGLTLDVLLGQVEKAKSDDIYTLIASEDIYVDLHSAPIPEIEKIHIFRTKAAAESWSAMFTKSSTSSSFSNPHTVSTEPNTPVLYDGRPWTILQTGKSDTQLLSPDKKLIKIPNERFQALVAEGTIIGIKQTSETGKINQEARKRYIAASTEALAEANRRFDLIKSILAGQAKTDNTSLGRSMRRWVARFLEAEQTLGYGYLGLLPDYARCGNRKPRIHEKTLKVINDFIEKEYENRKQKNKREVYGEFKNYCKKEGVTAVPSYKKFVEMVNNRPQHKQKEKRAGTKAAYPLEPIYWELIYTLPRHGDYPFQIVHIDHTQLDVELVDSRTGKNLGRPWLTLLIDAYSRRILAVYITFDKPSYRSCMMVLRECVYQHNRFPEMIVVDWGSEFHSIYLETLLARYKCSKATRPQSKPRFGSVIERVFNTTNKELIHNLEGNTQVTKNVRQMTKAVNPELHAVWTLGTLYACLQVWAYEQYNTNEHSALGQTPEEAFNQGLFLWGRREGDLIPYDDDFVRFTLPSTPKGTAKLQPNHGVKVNNIYYWSKGEVFRSNPELEKKQIPVRYDPYDVGHVFAYVNGKWEECISEYYTKLRGHSERELKQASAELRARNRRHGQQFAITAAKLADFITSAEEQELLLAQQRSDAELREVLKLMGKSDLGLHGVNIELGSPPATNNKAPLDTPSPSSPDEIASKNDDDDIYEVFIGE